jgi:hypothetical protein
VKHADAIAQVIFAIQSCGGRAVKRDTGLVYDANFRKRSQRSGPADVYGVLPGGRHFEAEVKIGTDPWRKRQRDWARVMAGLGALVLLARWHHRPVADEVDVLADIGGAHLLIPAGADAAPLIRQVIHAGS